jgi:hypothetical protein
MKKSFVIVSVLLVCGLVGGLTVSRGRAVAAGPAHGNAMAAAAAGTPAPALTSFREPAADQLQLDRATTSCTEGATSDAASCSTGGWVFDPNLGCCNLGPRGVMGKWRNGTATKCCGACAGL